MQALSTPASLVAAAVVVAFALLLIFFTGVVVVKREAAERFLSLFASSRRAHYTEQICRVLIGAALIVLSPAMWQPKLFWLVGWAIVVSSVALMCLPWKLHHRFGERIRPMFVEYLWLYTTGAFVFGVLLLYAVLVGGG